MNNEPINNDQTESLNHSIPLIVLDSMQSRYMNIIKWLVCIIALLILCLVGNNAYWQYLWNQYDYSSTETRTITVDGQEGNANYAESGGVITNGEDNSDISENKDEKEKERKEQGDKIKKNEVNQNE